METSAKANINIENVSTATRPVWFLPPLGKQAVRTLARPGWAPGWAVGYRRWAMKYKSLYSVKAILSHLRYANLLKLTLALSAYHKGLPANHVQAAQ